MKLGEQRLMIKHIREYTEVRASSTVDGEYSVVLLDGNYTTVAKGLTKVEAERIEVAIQSVILSYSESLIASIQSGIKQ